MSEFGVTFKGLQAALDSDRVMADRLAAAADEVKTIRGQLTFEIRQRSSIDSRLNAVSGMLGDQGAAMGRMVDTGSAVSLLYRRTESGLLGIEPGEMVWTQARQQPSAPAEPGTLPGDGEDSESLLEFFDFLKVIGKWLDSAEMGEGFGALGDLGEYLRSLYEFFTGDMKGFGGLADWVDLTGNSVGLWTGLYQFLDEMGAEGGLFNDAWRTGVKGAGLIGSAIGTIGAYIEMFNIDGQTTFGDMIDKAVDVGKSTADLIKSGLLLFADKGAGLPAHVYTSIAKAGISSVGQLFESIREYSADGVWDLGDTGETLIDFSTEGLYSLCNSVSFGGLDLLLDAITGNGGKDVDYGDLFAQGVKDFGQDAADWIVETSGEVSEAIDDAKDWIGDTINNFCNGWKACFS
ncbi:hypothetical protein INF35_08290 [Subdoligranulum sp. DSM 109015]|uniref:Uncharacterized protein n=1 Tax=Gemmiger gallinarum TaxID=2779354 RepID=A0ABR9R4E8_9FIRM|nr:hypothetical protein [Gemmiger gallinarum]MBE5037782.1 hypothetical protein [Gemmiger gallinarum]